MNVQLIDWDGFRSLMEGVDGVSALRLIQMPDKATSYTGRVSEMLKLVSHYFNHSDEEGWRVINVGDGKSVVPVTFSVKHEGEDLEEEIPCMTIEGVDIYGAESVVCCSFDNCFFFIPDEDTYKRTPSLNRSFVFQFVAPKKMMNVDFKISLENNKLSLKPTL